MKLCLLSIATALLSFVAAVPVLAPRAPSPPFKLLSSGFTHLPLLQAKYVPEFGGYYQLGWFLPREPEIALYIPDNEGPVLHTTKVGYQMVYQPVKSGMLPLVQINRVLLVNQDNTALVRVGSFRKFMIDGDHLSSYGSSDFWSACQTKQGLELYFGQLISTECFGLYRFSFKVVYQRL